jgi:UDP-glucose/iron transport system permease protein
LLITGSPTVVEPFSSQAVPVSYQSLGLAALLVLVAGGVSLGLRLRLEGQLLVAALRTVVQLLLVGYLLRYVFAVQSVWAIAGIVFVMLAAASRAALTRAGRTFAGSLMLAFFTLVLTGLATTYCVTGVIIGVSPWYSPQYLIPLLGMVLGNSLTGLSLCLDSLLEQLSERRREVEMELAHGATWREAALRPVRVAVRRGMIPTLNAMTVVGLVSLPGMMTGQILAGADPVEAVKYQVVVMFMLAAATAVGSMMIALLSCRMLFNDRHQLLVEKIR